MDGKQRDSDGACIGEVSSIITRGWPYYSSYKINTSTGAVLEQQTSIYANGEVHDAPPSIIENCRVVDASNWQCVTRVKVSVGGKPIDDGWHDGMKNGRAYRYASTDGVPDYYGSSISGIALLMFEIGLIDLKSAARGDVIYGLFHGSATPTSEEVSFAE